MRLGYGDATLAALALATVVGSSGCGGPDITTDPIGSSDFYLRNSSSQTIAVRYVGAGCVELAGKEIVSGGQNLICQSSYFWPPKPSEVLWSIEVWEPGEAGRVLYRQRSARDSLWQRTIVKSDYPQRHAYTLVYTDAMAGILTD